MPGRPAAPGAPRRVGQGPGLRGHGGGEPGAGATNNSSSAFCAWRRFSAWSQMRWRFAVEDLRGDLLAWVRGQVVHRKRARGGRVEQRVVELVGRERGAALGCGGLVAHAHPHVRVHRLRARDRRAGIGVQLSVPARAAARQRQILVQRVAGGRGDRHVHPGERAEQRQRARDVVAVADVGDAHALQRAAGLA